MSQFATFHVGEHLFGLDILGVREIIRVFNITPVPRAEPHIRGLINLRGQIVTILDLAVRLGLEDRQGAEESYVVILDARSVPPAREGQGEALAGFLVDTIGDVVEADPSLLEPAPANVTEADGRCVQGVLKTGTDLLLLLNLDSILGARP